MRNGGGGFAANISRAMPEGLRNDGFPVSNASSNDLFDRKRKRFLGYAPLTTARSAILTSAALSYYDAPHHPLNPPT